jgi:nucleoside-diphosphate-sugar epimerase
MVQKNTIAITGASGFVGSNLVSYLKFCGHSIIEVGRKKGRDAILVDEFTSEMINTNEINVVIHLAGKAHDLKNISSSEDYYLTNTELTKKLFKEFVNSKAQIFIFISTVKAIADAVEGVLDEEYTPNPLTHYGKSKLLAEQYIHQLCSSEKKYFIIRPCMIHGPGNKGNLNLLYKYILRGFPYPLAAFINQRSFLSINNLCFVIEQLLINDKINSGIYHLADDKPISTNQLIKLIGDVLGRKPLMWSIPPFLIKLLAKIGDFLSLPFNSDLLQKLTENYVVSNKKIVEAIGDSLPLETEQGLRQTLLSFKDVQ